MKKQQVHGTTMWWVLIGDKTEAEVQLKSPKVEPSRMVTARDRKPETKASDRLACDHKLKTKVNYRPARELCRANPCNHKPKCK